MLITVEKMLVNKVVKMLINKFRIKNLMQNGT